jgi:hypothetical protein
MNVTPSCFVLVLTALHVVFREKPVHFFRAHPERHAGVHEDHEDHHQSGGDQDQFFLERHAAIVAG